MDLAVWAVDIGSVKRRNFGWCRLAHDTAETGGDIRALVSGIARDLDGGMVVALGFECPLFVPITDDPVLLTSARTGERGPGMTSRAWSAGAGSGALATGLTESVWVLEQIGRLAQHAIVPTFEWRHCTGGSANLFIWEAFVSGTSKGIGGAPHLNDAEIAARAFVRALPHVHSANAVTAENPFCLAGAALLRARLSTDLSVLFAPCVVIRA